MSKTLFINEIVDSVSITHSFDKDELIFLNTSDILEGKIINATYMKVAELKGQAKKTIKNGDILFSEIRPKNKRYAKIQVENPQDYVVSTKLMVLRKFNIEVLLDYFYYNLINDDMLTTLQNRAENRICSFPQITFELLSEYKFRIPNKYEQQKIVDVLSIIDTKIELNNKTNSQLENLARTIYDYWFVQFDFPNAVGKPYKSDGGTMVWNKELKCEIPATWETTTINDVIAVKDGTHDSPKAVEIGYPLITSKHLMEWGLDFLSANLISESDYISINKRSKVDSGDILFSMIGSVGTVYKIDEKDISFAIKNVALYKTSENEEYKNFVYMWLKSYYMKSYMSNVLSGSIQKFIGLGDLRTMPIFVPNNETKSYYHLTRSIFEKSNIIREENQELTKLRDWLLPMLMNGQATVE